MPQRGGKVGPFGGAAASSKLNIVGHHWLQRGRRAVIPNRIDEVLFHRHKFCTGVRHCAREPLTLGLRVQPGIKAQLHAFRKRVVQPTRDRFFD